MARWGKADFNDLKRLQKKLEKLSKGDFERFTEATVKALAQRLLNRVIYRTPVLSGALRKGWKVGEVKRVGGYFEIEVLNPIDYAMYVEFGHRQQPGRFIPEIGKRLVNGWVEGKFMMTLSVEDLEKDATKIIEKRLEAFLGELFDG